MSFSISISLMPFYTVQVSAVTGNSISTAFSMCGGPIDTHKYGVSVWNLCSSAVQVCFSATTPTSTTFDRIFVPSGGTSAKDSNTNVSLARPGDKIWVSAPQTSIASGYVTVETW